MVFFHTQSIASGFSPQKGKGKRREISRRRQASKEHVLATLLSLGTACYHRRLEFAELSCNAMAKTIITDYYFAIRMSGQEEGTEELCKFKFCNINTL